MRYKEIVNEDTTAANVASVAQPFFSEMVKRPEVPVEESDVEETEETEETEVDENQQTK